MKFATHIVLFGQDKWIMKNIENSYKHVDVIYISYSKKPWGYNPNARKNIINSFNLDIIKESVFFDKITLIEGDWQTEEDQRNACVSKAKKDNVDYLMIHDADEFYHDDDFELILDFIKKNPDHDVYKCAWYNFWKTLDYITIQSDGNLVAGYPEIFINLTTGTDFSRKRRPSSNKSIIIPNVFCYHASYVLTDSEVKNKLNTWGHHNDFNTDKWYNEKWLNWNEQSIDLHPISPSAWKRAIKKPKDIELPKILKQ